MNYIYLFLAATLAVIGLIALHFRLRGARMTTFDNASLPIQRFTGREPSHPAQRAIIESLSAVAPLLKLPMRERMPALRHYMDEMFAGREFKAQFLPIDAGIVRGEWVLAPGADPGRRTLYIHGGAFTMGSPKSHRTLTTRFSELTGGAVFAVDYRLMPEHPRQAGIDDCRAAYRWLLDNGPVGPGPVVTLFIAGDSAGGNLTLSTIAWARDAKLRAADAAVALSPLTDATLISPSIKRNHATDQFLAPLVPWARWMPTAIMPWLGLAMSRQRPSDPAISPVRGNLVALPPTLIQASESEMLLDDARRYVAKAHAAGSPVRLQTWSHMVHVWQAFNPELDEARAALEQVGRFLRENSDPAAVVQIGTDRQLHNLAAR